MNTTQQSTTDLDPETARRAGREAELFKELDIAVQNLDGDDQEKLAAATLQGLPGVGTVRILHRGIWLKYQPGVVSGEEVVTALREAGFDARLFQDAATGQVGVVRRDPMAMLPFCGYNMGDYFAHWLRMGELVSRPPAIFHVNWFRTDARGRFVWPGFGENLRVLLWMIDRVKGNAAAQETPIGLVPTEGALNWDGLSLSLAERQLLLAVDRAEWAAEVPDIRAFFDRFGERLPAELGAGLRALEQDLSRVAV